MNDVTDAPFAMRGEDILLGEYKESPNEDMFIESGRHTVKPVAVLNNIFKRAIAEKAADIHFQQTTDNCRVRFRMPGGALVTIADINPEYMSVIDDKIRSRSHITTAERRSAHDGRMSLSTGESKIDVRVAITPGVSEGQLIVCRILNQSNSNKRLDEIEMPMATRESFLRLIDEPNGLFLITGPTGSGKTTTLYAMLNELNDDSKNIITVENPVEYRIKEFHQINVDGSSMTFASALRAVLRQDPDIVMVGEIRDHETANIAVQAAITGHLVLSTLHANNAPSAITRLVELGIDPLTLAAALRGVTAQRLVRTLSPSTDVPRLPPTEADKIWLSAANVSRSSPTYHRGAEIGEDGKSIYKGVVPVMEVILADHRVKKAIPFGEAEIYAAASRQAQFETLAQASERLAFSGRTTLIEAKRTASLQETPVITNKRIGQILVESGKVSAADMEALLTLQSQWRADGNPKKLGKILVERHYCSTEDLMEAAGYTAEAHDIISRLCQTEDRKSELNNLLRKWTPGLESLFKMAIESGLVTEEELKNENFR